MVWSVRPGGTLLLGVSVVVAAGLSIVPAAQAVPVPNLTVETFYSGPTGFRPGELTFTPAGDLLVADRGPLDGTTTDGSIVSVDPGGAASTMVTGLADPTGLAHGNGSADWGTDLYIADHNYLTLGSSYGEVFRYTGGSLVALPYAHDFPLLSDPFRLAFGSGGSYGSDLYVVDPSSGPGSSGGGTGYVRRITPSSQASFAGGAPFVSPVDVALGPGGGYGNAMYVADYEAEKIFTVDGSGAATDFASGTTAFSVAFSAGGALGTSLFVHEADEITQVDSSGVVTTVVPDIDALGIIGTGLTIDPAGSCLYYTAGATIQRACATAPVDVAAPTITIGGPADTASYSLGQAVTADYACEDEAGGSGLASCLGTVPDGGLIDTATVGSKTFSVDAADNAGNSASLSHVYSVVYPFSGFQQPVDNLPTVNSMKAGAAVPVSFSLGGNHGLGIFAVGYPKSETITCGSGALVDGIEQTVNAGGSSLQYDAATDTYSYVWKTTKSWAPTCRQLVVKFNDGTTHRANFLFR